jgi:hypothetical protein
MAKTYEQIYNEYDEKKKKKLEVIRKLDPTILDLIVSEGKTFGIHITEKDLKEA